MRDYYRDGYDDGYGTYRDNHDNDYPSSDGERYDYERGREDGQRRRDISRDIERDWYGD